MCLRFNGGDEVLFSHLAGLLIVKTALRITGAEIMS